MPRLSFTRHEIRVMRDALQHLSAYTAEEMEDHLDWTEDDIAAWDAALGKLTTSDEDAPDTTSVVAQEHNRRVGPTAR